MSLSENNKIEEEINLDKDCWNIIDNFFEYKKNNPLIKHQIESFNDFISVKIPDIIQQYNSITIYNDYCEDHNCYKKEVIVDFNNVYISKPTIHENNGSTKVMYPSEARLRNFTYASPIFVDINIVFITKRGDNLNIIERKEKELRKISIGKIPIMVQSAYCVLNDEKVNLSTHSECNCDFGGYFIINGSEKVLISQERQAENKAYAFKNIKQNTKYSHTVEMKSVVSEKISPAKTINVKITSKSGDYGRQIKVSIPHIRQDIPLFILFRALGIESDKEIIKYILLDDKINNSEYLNVLKPSIEEASNIQTQSLAQEYLLKYLNILGNPKEIKLDNDQKIKYLKDILKTDTIPHVGDNFIKKAYILGYMVKKLLDLYLDKINQDDRDSYINKRIETPGVLLSNIFRQYFTKLIKDMRNSIMKELNCGPWKASNKIEDLINLTNIYKIIKSTTIDVGMKYSLATGNWGIKNISKKVGVAQVLSRLSYSSTLSHCRRINTPIEKTGKLVPPRKLHATSWGYICPSETPEGGAVGVVKNLSLMSHITIFSSTESIISCLENLKIIKLEDLCLNDVFNKVKIFINGDWYGVCDNMLVIYNSLIDYRRQCIINPFCSICINYNLMEINIYTDGGRLVRPLLIVENNKLLLNNKHIKLLKENKYNWKNLICGNLFENNIEPHHGLIEYLDAQETNNSLIAPNYKCLSNSESSNHIYRYTHCEIHQSLILGVLAASIPCSDRNQSPRNTYQSAMGKQAMGIYATNFRSRMDTLAHILHHPMIPIVNTRNMKYLNSKSTPNGLMAIVAIATYSGYNQEDSIIMNKSAIERGLFQSTFYRSYKDEEKKNQINGVEEKFCKPNNHNTKGMKPGSYDNLDEDGFAIPNRHMNGGDIIIGKVIPSKDKRNNTIDIKKYRDNSTSLRSNESGIIDKVYQNRNGEGYRFCKIRVRSNRIPQIGDKFSSRHGQKGTVGIVYNQEDMPYSKDGIVPDLIINPHAIPSRMTIGQLIECIMGKACTHLGLTGDGTPFSGIKVNNIGDILENKCNMDRSGNEILYSGLNGKQLDCKIFMGPTYYQRLKHMVDDKIHSRSTGPLVLLTRQPAEGRSRDGGLRFGEMERDCMIAHGASEFLKERLLDMSDHYKVYICKKTGMISAVNYEKNIFNSFNSNTTEFSEIRIPYAYKLLIQELETMSICSRLLTV